MKKIILVIGLFVLVSTSFAQGGFSIGPKGGYGFTMLLDKNWSGDNGLTYVPSFGMNIGLSFGYNWTYYNFGLTTGPYYKVYKQRIDEKLEGSVLPMIDEFKFEYLEIPLMLRIRPAGNALTRDFTLGGAYFEIGAIVNSLIRATHTHTDTLLDKSFNSLDVKSKIESTNLGAMIGFGFHQFGTENFALTHGIRINFNFLTVVKADSYLLDRGYTTRVSTNNFQVGYIMAITLRVSDRSITYR